MSYNLVSVKKYLLSQWEEDNYFILKYFPYHSEQRNDATYFILDFKERDPKAIADASNFFISAINDNEEILKNKYHCKYVMSIPSHDAQNTKSPCEDVCATISENTWLIHVPNGLVRTQDVAKSARSPGSQRPNKAAHLKSISYNGQIKKDGDFGILMIDDVFTLGNTSSACREIILTKSKCQKVVGIFLGRTQYD
jgi:hypothetical protein